MSSNLFAGINAARRRRQAVNSARYSAAPEVLAAAGLTWTERNHSGHFMIALTSGRRVDLWPHTGGWVLWDGKHGHGVDRLLAKLRDRGELR